MKNNLPAIIPSETPEWFLWEMEDILDMLRRSNSKKNHSIVQLPELSYILSLADRLFQCGFINAEERNDFRENIVRFQRANANSRDFLVRLVFYIYSSWFLKYSKYEFKNTRDTLLEVARVEKRTQEVVGAIMRVDNRYFPELSPGETLSENGEVVDIIYRDLQESSDFILELLYIGKENFSLYIPEMFRFYHELLSLWYIDEDTYKELALSESRSYGASLCIWVFYAMKAGFFDHTAWFKNSFIPLMREYLKDSREFEIISRYLDSSTR